MIYFEHIKNYLYKFWQKLFKPTIKLKPTKLVKIKKARITKAELKDSNESV